MILILRKLEYKIYKIRKKYRREKYSHFFTSLYSTKYSNCPCSDKKQNLATKCHLWNRWNKWINRMIGLLDNIVTDSTGYFLNLVWNGREKKFNIWYDKHWFIPQQQSDVLQHTFLLILSRIMITHFSLKSRMLLTVSCRYRNDIIKSKRKPKLLPLQIHFS